MTKPKPLYAEAPCRHTELTESYHHKRLAWVECARCGQRWTLAHIMRLIQQDKPLRDHLERKHAE